MLGRERKEWGRYDSIRPPDFTQMYTKLKHRHITRQLLWEEYRTANQNGCGFGQYCQLYKNWSKKPGFLDMQPLMDEKDR